MNKKEANSKAVGKVVTVMDELPWTGKIIEVLDDENFFVKPLNEGEGKTVSIFDVRY